MNELSKNGGYHGTTSLATPKISKPSWFTGPWELLPMEFVLFDVKLTTGIQQGTVLKPKYLIFINELRDEVSPGTMTCIFTDDYLVYHSFFFPEDLEIF